jgi:F-type H+-transporting ATPase subunit delta
MVNKVSPKSYARAIFEIALERNELNKWHSDLEKMTDLAKDTVLLTLLNSPKLKFEDKAKMVNDRLPGMGTLIRNLAYLLIVKRKMNLIGGITKQYQQMVDNYYGIEHAEITTAIQLEDADKMKMDKVLSKILGKKLIIETKVDPAIIGGLVVRVNGKLLEGSTRNKLLSLKKELGGHK